MLNDVIADLRRARVPKRERLKKSGTIKINTVETTPVVWQDKLLRFEWARNFLHWQNMTEQMKNF